MDSENRYLDCNCTCLNMAAISIRGLLVDQGSSSLVYPPDLNIEPFSRIKILQCEKNLT